MESEFHTYIQPQEHPILSDFCTELTGITQQQVEAGVPLHICLSRFSRWLQALEHQRGVVFPRDQRAPVAEQRPCAFVTWSGIVSSTSQSAVLLKSWRKPQENTHSFEPDLNLQPKDCCSFTYVPPLFQLSYRRSTSKH
uniref:Exonuclease domain-containing protein n=1 Tax=Hucho hucho TaxID=62062 RepID=A0A4W5KG08_9TELE